MKKTFLIIIFILGIFIIPSNAEDCKSGGEGSTSCSYTNSNSGGVTILGIAVVKGKSITYSVSCGAGYYSCCSNSGATCKPATTISDSVN